MTTIPDDLAAHRDQLRGDALIDPGTLLPGLQIIVSPMLPMPSSPGEDARRMVRHAFAAHRRTTGERAYFPDALGDVGPLPGDPSHAFIANGKAFVSKEAADRLFDYQRAPHTGVRRGV